MKTEFEQREEVRKLWQTIDNNDPVKKEIGSKFCELIIYKNQNIAFQYLAEEISKIIKVPYEIVFDAVSIDDDEYQEYNEFN